MFIYRFQGRNFWLTDVPDVTHWERWHPAGELLAFPGLVKHAGRDAGAPS